MNTSGHPEPRRIRWPFWILTLLTSAGAGGIIWIISRGCESISTVDFWGILLGGTGFLILGGLVICKRPENHIGWLVAVIGTQSFIDTFIYNYVTCGDSGMELPALPLIAWANHILPPFFIVTLFILLPHWFPNGRFLSHRWQTVTWIGIGLFTCFSLILGLLPGKLSYSPIGVPSEQINPFGLPFLSAEKIGTPLLYMAIIAMFGSIFIAIASSVTRWRRSKGDERQQLKWFAYFLGAVVTFYLVIFEIGQAIIPPESLSLEAKTVFDVLYTMISIFMFGGFPIPIGIAVFKYRLYDIDLIIRRTLQYAILTGMLVLIYFGSVVVVQFIFSDLIGIPNSPLITVVSTLIIAALFNPLRTRVQDFIDRRFYRRKYNAERALAQFAATARDEVDMEKLTAALLGVVEETIQPETVTMWTLRSGKE